MSKVKDLKLADEGMKELEWAEKNMPILIAIQKRFEKEQPLKGKKVSLALHLEKKTGQLIRTLRAGGATVRVASCNPLTTDDRVAAALTKFDGIEVFAWVIHPIKAARASAFFDSGSFWRSVGLVMITRLCEGSARTITISPV